MAPLFFVSLIFILLSFICSIHGIIIVKSVIMNLTISTYDSRLSDFGPSFYNYDDSIRGYLVAVSPPEACTPLSPAPPPDSLKNALNTLPASYLKPTGTFQRVLQVFKKAAVSLMVGRSFSSPSNDVNQSYNSTSWRSYPMFALIRRGNCSFVQKVRTAQAANYSAVIVYDNVPSNSIFPMGHDKQNVSDINVPSVFVSGFDGMELQEFDFFNSQRHYIVVIYSDYIFPISFYLMPFFVVVIVGLIAMVGGFLLKVCLDWRAKRRNRLSRRHLKRLTEKKFHKGVDPYETCAICLDDYEEGDRIRILPCGHAFHSSKCIDPWLLKNKRNCPICKRRICIPNAPNDSQDEEMGEGTTGSTGNELNHSSEVDERRPLLAGSDSSQISQTGPATASQPLQAAVQRNAIGYGSTTAEVCPEVVTADPPSFRERIASRLSSVKSALDSSLLRLRSRNYEVLTDDLSNSQGNINPTNAIIPDVSVMLDGHQSEFDAEMPSTSQANVNHTIIPKQSAGLEEDIKSPDNNATILSCSMPSSSSVDGELFHSFQQRALTPAKLHAQGYKKV
jgi:hypothetical protein